MKKLVILLVLIMAVGFSATLIAAPGDGGGRGVGGRGGGGRGGDLISQGELGQMMVRILGLSRFLPSDPTDQECFSILMVNGIRPVEGWDTSAAVTREDLARVVLTATGEQGSVENPEDPASWVATLQGMGVDIESVGQTVSQVGPEKDFRSTDFNPASSDPVKRQRFFTQPDERSMQNDMGAPFSAPLTFDEVKRVVRGLDPNDFKPEPVTPN